MEWRTSQVGGRPVSFVDCEGGGGSQFGGMSRGMGMLPRGERGDGGVWAYHFGEIVCGLDN